ncbi:MAG TPA: DNA polymerase III subunit gamma/tau, partial [Burkholderiaceae bacterium]|nr:DNA polymerase III subunit gamma/tau [Burkholderiaceae bacterium]
RLHHAYLFTGTRGIGKTTVSRILAKSLNCTGPDGAGGITAHPCGQCSACVEIDADRYIDYIELDAASNRGIDEIRDLLERAAYKPSIGRFKVFMIDEAHQLTKESFNALLKTLEEPPEYLKFVLATTDPDKMLPTVLSRCLQFNLRPMPPDVVRDYLRHVLAAEAVGHDDGSVRLLGRAARGSMRDALSLADQAIAYGGGRLDEAVVQAMLGTVDRHHASSLVQALADRDGARVLEAVNLLRTNGLSAAGTLEELATLLQQMAIEQAVPGALDENDPDTADARRLASMLPPDETQLLYSIALHGRSELSLVSDEYAALTMVLLRLLAFPSARATGAATASGAGSGPAGGGVPSTSAATGPAAAVASLQSTPEARASVPARPASALPVGGGAAGLTPSNARPIEGALARQPTSSAAGPRPDGERHQARPSTAVQEPPPWLDEAPFDDGPVATLQAVETVPPMVASARALPRMEAATPASAIELPRVDRPAKVEPFIDVQRTPLGDRWAALVSALNERGAVSALVRELAMQAELVDVSDQVWQLRVERDSLRVPALRDKLQAALESILQPVPTLELQAGVVHDSPARRDAAERERRQREAEDIIRNDPLVRELMTQFKTARIVPGSIRPV